MTDTNFHFPESQDQSSHIRALMCAEGIKWATNERIILGGLLANANTPETTGSPRPELMATRFPLHLVPEIVSLPNSQHRDYLDAA